MAAVQRRSLFCALGHTPALLIGTLRICNPGSHRVRIFEVAMIRHEMLRCRSHVRGCENMVWEMIRLKLPVVDSLQEFRLSDPISGGWC